MKEMLGTDLQDQRSLVIAAVKGQELTCRPGPQPFAQRGEQDMKNQITAYFAVDHP